MGDNFYLPRICKTILSTLDTANTVTLEELDAFLETIQNRETLIPELVDIIGGEAFILLVKRLGGNAIRLPRIQEVSKGARDSHPTDGQPTIFICAPSTVNINFSTYLVGEGEFDGSRDDG